MWPLPSAAPLDDWSQEPLQLPALHCLLWAHRVLTPQQGKATGSHPADGGGELLCYGLGGSGPAHLVLGATILTGEQNHR